MRLASSLHLFYLIFLSSHDSWQGGQSLDLHSIKDWSVTEPPLFESRGIGFLWCVHERIWVIFSPKWRTTAFQAGLAPVICKETWFSKLCGNAFGQARPVSLQENFSNFILEIGGISHRVTLQKLSIRTPKLKWFWWESQGWSGPYYINQVGFQKMKYPIFIHC